MVNPILNTAAAGINHPLIRTALTDLNDDIRARIDRERLFIVGLKHTLNGIIQGIQGCVAAAAAVVGAPGAHSAADLDAIADDINDIGDQLNTVQPFEGNAGVTRESRAILDPLLAYSPHLRTELTPGPNIMPGNIPRAHALIAPGQNLIGGWTPNKKTKRRRKNRTYYKL